MATRIDETFQRQRDEIALIEAMYPEDRFRIEVGATVLSVHVRLGATIPFPIELTVKLPEGYPCTHGPELSVSCPRSSRQVQERLHVEMQRIVSELSGRDDEILDEILNQFKQFVADFRPDHVGSDTKATVTVDATPAETRTEPDEYGTALVVVLWFHHLFSTTKRSNIVTLALNHELTGVGKPGSPACLIVEGVPSDVRDYVAELRSWRWQGFQVRAEHILQDGRRMSKSWDEGPASGTGWKGILEVEKMAEVVKAIQPYGLDELFTSAMRLGS